MVDFSKKKSIVYLIADSFNEGIYKIGVTRGSIERRIKKLQTGNSGELYLFDYYETYYPFYIEKNLHLMFHNENVSNEWFKLTLDDVKKFKDNCKMLEERIETLKDNEIFMNNLK